MIVFFFLNKQFEEVLIYDIESVIKSQVLLKNKEIYPSNWASLWLSVKNLPAMPETWIQSLGWEDPLEKGIATHSSILAWRIPMGLGAWWATVYGAAKSQTRLSN